MHRASWFLLLVACGNQSFEAEVTPDQEFGEGALLALPAKAAPTLDEALAPAVEDQVVVEVNVQREPIPEEVDTHDHDHDEEPAGWHTAQLRSLTKGGCHRSPDRLPSLLLTTDDGTAWDVSCMLDVATEDLVRCPCVTPRTMPSPSEAACMPVDEAAAEVRDRFAVYASESLGKSVQDGPVQLCMGV